jgi:peptide/nickel transport system substrate-binding protein
MVDQLLSTGDDRPFEAILIGLTGGSRLYPFGSNVVPCAGNLHMFNTSGECLTPQERLMERLYFEGRQTLDTEAARDIGFEIQRIEAELQPIVYTVSPSAHASWLNSVGGEYPRELMSDLVGRRSFVLTYKR